MQPLSVGKIFRATDQPCEICVGGKYQPSDSPDEDAICTLCPAGYASGAGANACDRCSAGYFSDKVEQKTANHAILVGSRPNQERKHVNIAAGMSGESASADVGAHNCSPGPTVRFCLI